MREFISECSSLRDVAAAVACVETRLEIGPSRIAELGKETDSKIKCKTFFKKIEANISKEKLFKGILGLLQLALWR